ncbi:MAG: hypothetical protein ABSE48_09900 [Verrucomicrobiota bacterium]|jgi:hypothetical protein
MKSLNQSRGFIPKILAALIAAGTLGGFMNSLLADDANAITASSPTNSVVSSATPPEPAKAKVRRHLTGAELYSIHCNRCHPERYPTERTGAQWKTIMLHMQVRANIPVSQSRLILKYLQENSGR